MKLIYLLVLTFLPFFLSNGKSRIGEYYLGFGYGTVDDSDGLFDGDSFNFFTNSLASDSVDLNFHYTYSGLDTNSSKETFWKLGRSNPFDGPSIIQNAFSGGWSRSGLDGEGTLRPP